MLNNIKTLKNDKGFTIVELLIVIVVIAILAAITIVAYNGIQSRAKATSGQSLANSIVKKAEAWNSLKSAYPTRATLATGATDAGEAKIDDPAQIIAAAVDTTTARDGKTVTIQACGTTGGKVGYWDYSATTPAVVWVYMGTATSTTTGCA